MKQLLASRPCNLGCGREDDGLGHYQSCRMYWDFIRKPRPSGPGLEYATRAKETSLLLGKDLVEDDVIRLAAGLCALYTTVNFRRFSGPAETPHRIAKLLKGFTLLP